MSAVSVLVLRAAGINCDHETVHAFRATGANRVDHLHINELIAGRDRLSDYHILTLPGGFSYGDDISGGKVLANELQYKLMEQIEVFIRDGGLILGICNGFQAMVKMGLLPQTSPGVYRQETTVFYNDSGRFECRWVHLSRNPESPCVFTRNMPDTIYIPVAHGEGKIMPESENLRARLHQAGHVPLRYMDPSNGHGPVAYPWSPNGSVDEIAGLCDTTGRIFGLMPHPERYMHPTHHPRWTRERPSGEPDGTHIFRNAVDYVRQGL